MIIYELCLDTLPKDGSTERKNIALEQEEDLTLPDMGPTSNDQFEDYREQLNTSCFLPYFVKQPTEDKALESFVETISSPELDIGDDVFNEFENANLAKMAFPTLFPDGLGDQTDNATVCDISNSETDSYLQKPKHLVRFG